ncbi:MAG TPA: DUF2334 domain-containing protein [Burkholderiales bacterium]
MYARLASAALLALVLCLPIACRAAGELKVCLYFDGEENTRGFTVGERSAVMIANLLGHFKEAELSMKSVAQYAASDLVQCDRALYVGTYFDAKVPDAFLADVGAYRKPFLWINYNIWKLQAKLGAERFRALTGFVYQRIESAPPHSRGVIPAFFSHFTYKGATFRKVAYLDDNGGFIGYPEIVIVRSQGAEVLSEGIHSRTKASTPYALRKGGFFYVADNPVSVIDERDRYLIFADLLFDFLGLEPRTQKRYAVVRIEDIHPAYDLRLLFTAIETFRLRKVPFAISLIPRYIGPGTTKGIDLQDDPRFLRLIRYAIANGASILMHGYEHHVTVDLGCGLMESGEDYEFWDRCRNAPLPYDSEQFVQERIDKGKKILTDLKIPIAGWVTPHYMASPLTYRVVHKNIGHILQRMRYFLEGRPMDGQAAIDQFFPYPIVKDYYGSYVWPENLGYLPLPKLPYGGRPQGVEEMIETARLNRVVRDAWASFFWHPPLIRTELGIQSLERLIDGVRGEGYEFVSLQELRNRGE